MKKKIALVMASLLMLTALLTTSFFTPLATAPDPPSPGPGGIYHWKIMLAQKGCNAKIEGNLTFAGEVIPGTNFTLVCNCTLPEPQPLGQFVFWKVSTTVIPDDIHYIKYIDEDKNPLTEPIIVPIDHPIPYGPLTPEEPHTWYEHVEEGTGPFGPWMVVVEVREQPYDEDRPFFEWQLMIKQENCNALWTGVLTDMIEEPIPGTDFQINCTCTSMQCVVVRTPYCTVPHDIDFNIVIFSKEGFLLDDQLHHEKITQFPWIMVKSGIDPYTGNTWRVELELTEVQMHRYFLMSGEMDSAGSLGPGKALWSIGDYQYGAGTPFATRAPKLDPLAMGSNITFTQRDPITGIVKLGVPAESYVGLKHIWYGNDSKLWYNMSITMKEQGCGYLFTGVGKDPILGDVDLMTYNDYGGVYSLKPGHEGEPIEVGPCLEDLSGPDGIPGTTDDPIGDGKPDLPGSSILYQPTTMTTYYWGADRWLLLFSSPWPQLMTTGNATDTVIAPASEINGQSASAKGQRWEFFAGNDTHGYTPSPTDPVPWKHSKCNAYVTTAAAWSVLGTDTPLGWLDVCFYINQKIVREDCVIADINCDEVVNIKDIVTCALAFGAKDEGRYVTDPGPPPTYVWRDTADSNYNAAGDLMAPKGTINIKDIVRIAIDFGAKLTPNCIIRPT